MKNYDRVIVQPNTRLHPAGPANIVIKVGHRSKFSQRSSENGNSWMSDWTGEAGHASGSTSNERRLVSQRNHSQRLGRCCLQKHRPRPVGLTSLYIRIPKTPRTEPGKNVLHYCQREVSVRPTVGECRALQNFFIEVH